MAESFDKFFISIDADVSTLEAELIKAQNELRKFQNTLKKTTDVGTIKTLNENIANTSGKIAHLNDRLGQSGKSMGDASQSLINFSRIAQDAPYGIMGIANNLNPMVESFQRLAATEGGTKKALQAMAAGLIGPAGVGVAIGIVSSLAVTFSKEISNFFKGPTSALESFRAELNKVASDLNKLIGKEQTKRTQGILLTELIVGGNATQQKEALKQLQDLYSKSAAIQNAKLGQDKAYYQTLVNQAAMQGDATAKEKNNLAQLDIAYAAQIENEKKRNAELKNITSERLIGTGFATQRQTIQQQKELINATYDILGKDIQSNITKLEFDTSKQLAKVTLVPTPDKNKAKETLDTLKEFSAALKYELFQQLFDYEKYKKRFAELGKIDIIPYKEEDKPIKDSIFIAKDKKRLGTPEENSLGQMLLKDAARRRQLWGAEQKQVDQAAESYKNFANMLAGDVTNGLLNVFDALQKGESPLDAIGKMFTNIAMNIAAAILQATIFEAILTAFPELKAVFAAGSMLGNAFSGARATGGITNGPSMALVGEAGPEAIIPLSKLSGMLNTTFNAGSMSGGGGSSNGQFVLRGQDLLLATNRAQKASNLKGQSISLA